MADSSEAAGAVVVPAGGSGSTAARARKPGKPLNLFYTPIHDRNIGSVKLLVSTVLPVRYSDEFYRAVIAAHADFNKMAYYDDVFVGAICSRLEGLDTVPGAVGSHAAGGAAAAASGGGAGGVGAGSGGGKRLYITVIAVLSHYRGRGVGSALLQSVLDSLPKHPEVRQVALHVHQPNEDAAEFYEKHGFQRVGLIEGYYPPAIDPPHAWLFTKRVNDGPAPAGGGKH